MIEAFKPAFGLKNRHIQTLYSSLFRKYEIPSLEFETFYLEDGDFIDVAWHNKPQKSEQTPIVILFHGLTGSYKSPYISQTMKALADVGFSSVIMHFRGSLGKDNYFPKSYHGGETLDALAWINEVHKEFSNSKIFAVGFSLGANMLLKLLGEEEKKLPLIGAMAVSAPMNLEVCTDAMNRGFSKFYQYILLKDSKFFLERKFQKHDMSSLLKIKKEDIKNLKSFWDFDNAYTAPIHGFHSAQDYYTQCSARNFLKNIQTPTLILHAKDDPFMTPDVIPLQEELSATTTLEVYDNGGHIGFVNGTLFKPEYWLEKRVAQYFKSFLNSD